jgi:hypothetical protein
MKAALKVLIPEESHRHWVLAGLYRENIYFFVSLLRSIKYTYQMTGKIYPWCVRVSQGQRLRIDVSPSSTVSLSGTLKVVPWHGENGRSTVSLASFSTLRLLGDFIIGPNVHLRVSESATLQIGGRESLNWSGITKDASVIARSSIIIGTDALVSWGVVITDSDWHDISWDHHTKPIVIGSHVWICHGSSIMKGVTIGSGSVIAAKSLLVNQSFGDNSLVAGVPAKVLRENITWSQ